MAIATATGYWVAKIERAARGRKHAAFSRRLWAHKTQNPGLRADAIAAGRTNPAEPSRRRSASASWRVSVRLTMATGAPFRFAMSGSLAAGLTTSELPTTNRRSALRVSSMLRSSAARGSGSPKSTVAVRRMPPHTGQAGKEIPVAQPLLNLFAGKSGAAVRAADDVRRAMQLDDQLRIRSGALMQTVDVLRDDAAEFAASFQIDQRAMRRVRLRLEQPGIGLQSPLPISAAACFVFHEVADGRRLAGRPDTVRPAIVGDAGLGRDSCSREDHDAIGVADEISPARRLPTRPAQWQRVRAIESVKEMTFWRMLVYVRTVC